MLKSFLISGVAASALIPAAAAAQETETEDTIVVSASPLHDRREDLIAPVSILAGEDLQRQLRANLGETLRREPGLSSTQFGAGASRPIIRGLTGDRVRTLTNGVGSIDAATASPDHATPIEPLLAERIEVVRGTTLLRYGSSASGGVVNVLDGRIVAEAPEDQLSGALRSAYTTVDDGIENSAGVKALLGRIGGVGVVLTAQVSHRDADDYEIPGFAESARLRALEEEEEGGEHGGEDEDRGVLENSFNEVLSQSGGLSFVGDRGFLGFSVQRFESEYGIPGGHGHGHGHGGEEHGAEEEEEEGGVFLDLEQTRYDVNGSLELGGFLERADLFAGYADYQHTEFEPDGEAGSVFSNEGYEVRVEAIQAQRGPWHGATGIQVRGRDYSSIGEEAFVPETSKFQFGLYTFQELELGKLTLEGALRYEHTNHENSRDEAEVVAVTADGSALALAPTARERTFDTVSGSVGGRYQFSELLSGTVQLLRTERAPVTEELFSNGPHLATESFDVGNGNLDIETATGIEAGLRFGNDRAYVVLNGFYTDYQDFIFQRGTALTGEDVLLFLGETDPEELEEFGELTVFDFDQIDATFKGFEIEALAELFEIGGTRIVGDLVADYVDAELDRPDALGNEELPRIPPFGVIAGLEAQNSLGTLRAELEYSAEVDDVASFELPTDEFTLVNLYADWNVSRNVTFSVAALNVTDEEARLHTSFLKDVAPLPGRNIRFALRYDF